MPNEPQFVTCPCKVCNGHIEFDPSDFGNGETRTVECPHCKMETILFVPDKKAPKNEAKTKVAEPKVTEPKVTKPKVRVCPTCSESISRNARFCVHCGEPFPDESAGWIIGFFAAVIFLAGGAFFVDGFMGNSETIMQQSYLQARECFGLILMALSVLIAGIVRVIRKQQ